MLAALFCNELACDGVSRLGLTDSSYPVTQMIRKMAREGARFAFAAGLACFMAAGCDDAPPATKSAMPAAPPAAYVGGAACATCHAKQTEAWRGSQHDRAMQVANAQTALGDFNDAKSSGDGVVSTFFKHDDKLFVRTDGPDGRLTDFEIRYTFGVYPLQQYLIALDRGRLQALGIAWDTRPKAQGGQRWFHLYPDQKLKPGHPLHWTGIDQNWNYQCADCHSTNLRKNYDEQTSTFKTTWTDLNVGCEACHGPGSNHLAWAKREGDWKRFDGNQGLVVTFDERRGAGWTIDPASGNARRAKPRESNREIETCARCHARRGQFSDTWQPGQPLGDAFRAAPIDPGLYHVDGQQRDEVYTYGSFLQSRMYAHGVTCSDCHEPHSQKLRAPGNAVCAQCHASTRYDTPTHTHHPADSHGAQCTACHMPTTTYMLVDPRHDHSFRIPRPDRTLTLGVPNACNGCHTKQSAKWAADAVAQWFPTRRDGFQTFAEKLHAGDQGAPGAQDALIGVAEDRAQPSFARASAVQRLARYLSPTALPTLQQALNDADPSVRAAAVGALANADAATRARICRGCSTIRCVRCAWRRRARWPVSPRRVSLESDRVRFQRALDEQAAALRYNADRPEAQTALGNLEVTRGRIAEAEAAYRKALDLDPTFVEAAVNLADLQRRLRRDDEAEHTIRDTLQRAPQSAPAHHALGLALIRQQRKAEAVVQLALAAKLAPDDARFAYVYGVALHDTGKPAEALKTLRAALTRHPYDREMLVALVTYERESGDLAQAREHARLLHELEPENQSFARLATELDTANR